MINDLVELDNSLKDYLKDKITLDDLQQKTLALISSESFDELAKELQDAIYLLDNIELEELSNKHIADLELVINKYI